MVGVAQLVEHRLVVPVAAGSSPVIHPMLGPESSIPGRLLFPGAPPGSVVVGVDHHGSMAANKTQPTDADVDAFLDAATPARRREDGHRLAEIMRDVTEVDPVMWGPSMVGFGSYRYISPSDPRRRDDWPKVAFSPRKAQLSLYGLKDLPEGAALLPQLGTYTEGAGCVYVKKLDDVDLDVLRKLVEIAWSREDDPEP